MATLHSKLTSIQERLTDMDASGVDAKAISPVPHQYYYWAPDEVGRDAAMIVNDSIAEIVSMHSDRFVGIGTVPLQNPKMAIVEMERAVKKLGLRAIEIGTNVNGIELSDARYHKFFATAQELGILIFMHPLGTTEGKRLSEHCLFNIAGNPMDSTIAVSNLIFEGVLEKYPKLNMHRTWRWLFTPLCRKNGARLPYETRLQTMLDVSSKSIAQKTIFRYYCF